MVIVITVGGFVVVIVVRRVVVSCLSVGLVRFGVPVGHCVSSNLVRVRVFSIGVFILMRVFLGPIRVSKRSGLILFMRGLRVVFVVVGGVVFVVVVC